MATKTTGTYLNFVESMQRVGPDGNLLSIAEALNEMNEILPDAYMKQANDVFSHLEGVRDRLPTVSSRNFNTGSTRTSSKVRDIREQLTILEPWIEQDEAIVEKQPSVSEYLAEEWMAFGEAGIQEFARQLFYGNPSSDAREITGLSNRSDWDAAADSYVIDVGGSGSDNASLWIIEWGPGRTTLLYPRGHESVGIKEDDLGKYRITDSSNNPYMVYGYRVLMEFGITIPDTRAVQRLASIESDGSSNNLVDSAKVREIVRAKNKLPASGQRNTVIYVNRDLKAQFDIYALEKSNGFYMLDNLTGGPMTSFQGIPIRVVEQLVSTETAL